MRTVPYGLWPSPITPEQLAAGRISVSGLQVTGDGWWWWSETRPEEGGRQVVVRGRPGVAAHVVSPDGVSIRSRVHEYGGVSFTVAGAELVYVDAGDQGLWAVPVDGSSGARRPGPRPLTVPAPDDGEDRYGEPRPWPGTSWVVALRERHRAGEVVDEIVAVDIRRPATGAGEPEVLVSGRDLFASARPSPDGQQLAWVAWDLPNMPWESSELWLAALAVRGPTGAPLVEHPRQVAGGNDRSVGQPEWDSRGRLLFVSDEHGWWQPHVLDVAGSPRRLSTEESEFHGPDWAFGQRTVAPLADGSLVARVRRAGRDVLVRVGSSAPAGDAGADPGTVDLGQPCVTIGAVQPLPDGDAVAVLGATAGEAAALYEVRMDGAVRLVHRPAVSPVASEHVSVGRHVEFATRDGAVARLLFFEPRLPGVTGPRGERPPLVVFCHGGPTGQAEPGLDLLVQWWTTRGVAVAVVDYRGSSGYGRSYRQALRGRWGEVDASDCMDAAAFLAAEELVDGRRMIVRGSSAGGFTALRALRSGTPFAAAVTLAPVTDLSDLARATHKFESGYFAGLVGPWPEQADRYEARSPARHPEELCGPVLLLQGADDPVVPPGQARSLAAAMAAAGVRCELEIFPGEGHGLRRAESLAAAARLELSFVTSILDAAPPAPGS